VDGVVVVVMRLFLFLLLLTETHEFLHIYFVAFTVR